MLGPLRNSRLPPLYILLTLGLLTVFFYYRSAIGSTITSHTGSYGSQANGDITPANSTLGFGGLYVVSGPASTRRKHLLQAAAVTELDLTIPDQTAWSGEDVLKFRVDNVTESKIGIGSVKAWLSHHLVLNAFLDSGLESVLIFEDDVDWDIRLRTQQIPRAQQAAQQLSGQKGLLKEYPWGLPEDWDLLYLGHCGDYFNSLDNKVGVGHHHPEDLDRIPHVVFGDPTLPHYTDLHPFTASLLTAFMIPERHRVLHKSKWPLCSFGYAVTRNGAKKILTEVAPPKEDLSRNLHAYDSALLAGCRDTPLKCYSLNPEVFHHMEGRSMIAAVEEQVDHKTVFRPPVDVAGYDQVLYRGETSNIGCGFWSGEFYYDDEPEKLEILREEVGRKGRCIKEGRTTRD